MCHFYPNTIASYQTLMFGVFLTSGAFTYSHYNQQENSTTFQNKLYHFLIPTVKVHKNTKPMLTQHYVNIFRFESRDSRKESAMAPIRNEVPRFRVCAAWPVPRVAQERCRVFCASGAACSARVVACSANWCRTQAVPHILQTGVVSAAWAGCSGTTLLSIVPAFILIFI